MPKVICVICRFNLRFRASHPSHRSIQRARIAQLLIYFFTTFRSVFQSQFQRLGCRPASAPSELRVYIELHRTTISQYSCSCRHIHHVHPSATSPDVLLPSRSVTFCRARQPLRSHLSDICHRSALFSLFSRALHPALVIPTSTS